MTRKKEPENKPEVRDADDVIRSYYEGTPEGAFREDGTEPVSSVREDRQQDAARSAELSGGDVDAAPDQGNTGEEAVGGSTPTPDQDIVDEIGKAAGVTYQDNEPLKFEEVAERDERRWELDPASSEDYQERMGEAARSQTAPDATGQTPSETRSAKPKSKKAAGGRKAARGRPPS
jgi:hypothetical protein